MTTETCTDPRPLMTALLAAVAAHDAAEVAYDECDCDCDRCEHFNAYIEADEAVDAARAALRDSDEPRLWHLNEGGYEYDTIEASSLEEALDEARTNVDRANYSDAEGTIWVSVAVHCAVTGEAASDTVTSEPDEPECEDQSQHAWADNGVWINGGGLIIHEVCDRCGCTRATNTWAQNPATGEQGLTSVRYWNP